MKTIPVSGVDTCIFCNSIVPEGRQICPSCEMMLSSAADHSVEQGRKMMAGISKKSKSKKGR